MRVVSSKRGTAQGYETSWRHFPRGTQLSDNANAFESISEACPLIIGAARNIATLVDATK